MHKRGAEKTTAAERRTSIQHTFLVFSVVLFLIVFVGGSGAFVFSMRQIAHSGANSTLRQVVEVERLKLESSVNGEIAIALKMADSPLIKRYFLNPADPELEKTAFEEIAAYRRAFAANSIFWVNDADKKFYSDDAYAYTVDAADPGSYWYLMTLRETEKYNFNINYNADIQKTNLWINAPVFAADGTPIGIVGTGIDITAFIDSIYRAYTNRAALYFFNGAGEITGARDAKLAADKKNIADVLGKTGAEIAGRAKKLQPGELQFFADAQEEIVVGTVPALGWYIAAVQRLSAADYLKTTMTILFLAMMGIIALIFVIVHLFIGALLKPMGKMVETLNVIAADWDLTRRLEIKRRDEIGTLADFFNLTFEKIMELIRGIKAQTFSLNNTGQELSTNMTQTSAAIELINDHICENRC